MAAALVRDPLALAALLVLVVIVLAAVFAEVVAPYDPNRQALLARLRPPLSPSITPGAPAYLFGTDALGRDVLSRLIHGARISLAVGVVSVLLSGTVGALLGLLAGYFRGVVDDIIMRLVDIKMGFPTLLLALLVLYALGPGVVNVILVIAITRWTIYTRLTRSLTLTLGLAGFVEAARVAGAGHRHIIRRHLLPNVLSPVVVLATIDFSLVILIEASLDFLGLGIQPPQTSWGLMLAQGRDSILTAGWLVAIPGLMILVATLSLNLLATWLRAVTDPLTRWRWLDRSPPSRGGDHA